MSAVADDDVLTVDRLGDVITIDAGRFVVVCDRSAALRLANVLFRLASSSGEITPEQFTEDEE